MTAALGVTPNPVAPSATFVATGTGFDTANTRLRLGKTILPGVFQPTAGAFAIPVTAPSTRGTYALKTEQKPGKRWVYVGNQVSVVVQSAVVTPPPPVISNAVVNPVTETTAVVSWALSQPGTGQIEHGPVTSPQTYPFLTTLEPNYYSAHSQEITGLPAGTPRAYRIRSGNANGAATPVVGTFSTLFATPALTVPGAPTGLTAVAGDTVVDLAWAWAASDGGSAITGARVYRGATLVATLGVVTTFHDVGRTNGVLLSYTVVALNAVGPSAASGAASATPAGSALVFPQDRNPVIFKAETVPSIPAIGTPLLDPDWPGSPSVYLRRLGAANSFRPLYSRHQVENRDGSLLLMGFRHQEGGGQEPHLLHGTTYADLGAFPGAGLVEMAVWSNLDANKLFGVLGNKLVSQNATTGAITTVHAFAGYTDGNHSDPNLGSIPNISLGHYEGGISDDDNCVALLGWNGSAYRLITYKIDTNTVADTAAPAGINDCQISRLGTYVTAATGSGIRRYPRDLSSSIVLQSAYSHGDNALDASGNEIFVVNSDQGSPSRVRSYRLSDGSNIILLTGSVFDAGHVGGHGPAGLVCVSNYDETYYGTSSTKPGRNQVVALKTDGSGTAKVFCHTRHLYDNSNPDKRYTNEPHASLSRDGTRAFFTTNWRDAASWGYPFVAYA